MLYFFDKLLDVCDVFIKIAHVKVTKLWISNYFPSFKLFNFCNKFTNTSYLFDFIPSSKIITILSITTAFTCGDT